MLFQAVGVKALIADERLINSGPLAGGSLAIVAGVRRVLSVLHPTEPPVMRDQVPKLSNAVRPALLPSQPSPDDIVLHVLALGPQAKDDVAQLEDEVQQGLHES